MTAPSALTYQTLPRRSLVLTVIGLMLTLLLTALDQTIVGTAMPQIIADLHGFEHYAWVTTAYLLTSTTVVPISGKLSDMYGRKMFLLAGSAGFVLTSALCGLSQDMTQLIVFRGMQGVAGGVLTSTVFTVISQIFPPAERARFQGIFSGIFGFASVVGPLIGGYLTDSFSWRWVFYVNLPVGALAFAVLWASFPNIRPAGGKRYIDYLGVALLVLGVVPLLLALSWGGNAYPWGSPTIIGLFVLAAVMLVFFGVAETRAIEPIIPMNLFKNSVVSVSVAAMAIMSMGMFGTILFIPLFLQGVIGATATQSGTLLMPMTITMILTSILSGQIISHTGRYKLAGVLGMLGMAFGLYLLSGMGADTDVTTVIRNLVIVGLSIGPMMPVFTLAAQNAVRLNQLGVVTSLTQFSRSIGSTIGVALFGSLLTNQFLPTFQAVLAPDVKSLVPPAVLEQFENPQVLLSPQITDALRAQVLSLGPQGEAAFSALSAAIRIGLVGALHDVFLVGSALGLIGVVVVLFLKELPLRRTYAPASEDHLDQTAAQVGEAALPSLPPLRPRQEPAVREPVA